MAIIKLLVEGGKMTPGPAVAQQLGPMGINLGQLISDVNDKTKSFAGMNVPVILDVDADTIDDSKFDKEQDDKEKKPKKRKKRPYRRRRRRNGGRRRGGNSSKKEASSSVATAAAKTNEIGRAHV